MHIIITNISWMGFNIFLALIAVLFGWLVKQTTWKLLRILYGVVWILFLPNTLYLLTDIIHFFENMQYVAGIYKVIFVLQYLLLLLLGVTTYFAALYPIEQVFATTTKWQKSIFILLINLLVGFGMTLGRVERVNSWDIVLDIPSVLQTSTHMLTSTNSLLLILLFTAIGTLVYFSLRALVLKTVGVIVSG